MTDQEKQTIIKALNFTVKNCLCDASFDEPDYHNHSYSCVLNQDSTVLFKHIKQGYIEPIVILTIDSVEILFDVLNIIEPALLNYALNQNQPHE